MKGKVERLWKTGPKIVHQGCFAGLSKSLNLNDMWFAYLTCQPVFQLSFNHAINIAAKYSMSIKFYLGLCDLQTTKADLKGPGVGGGEHC